MGVFISTLASTIPSLMIKILARIFTEAMIQNLLERLILMCLEKASKLTTNTIDDSVVEEIRAKLKSN
jgi:hypothetical protein